MRIFVFVVALGVAGTASAQERSAGMPMLQLDAGDQQVGMMASPAFGGATAFMTMQAIETSNSRWFDRGWAIAELAAGIAGSAYSSWLLYGAIQDERGQALPIASWTAGAALGMNLRLVTHGVMSYALYDGGTDPLVRAIVPSIAVSPLEGGAMVSLRWTV